ncbi:MAG: DUF308 domain-containing protein [Treponema sp.]|uniref:DUF308 domain-containing protein n=1 Tax=Treponema sp. TaxID=166 RepID=UPI0025DD3CB7|nr:DUF308 domain-containing protein [Treponema sp.]MBQ9623194.1 DUF308 domain-containing protein [Treponema sp.]MBR0098722.1 DUF308 domain-containing protein [Treponema sp.]MBR0497357.1 DUF308 domain-containing protein [Treponema sp.]
MDKNKLFLGFMTAALGLFLLISPDTFISFFVILLGLAAIIDGIFILTATRDLIIDPQYKLIVTVRGVLSVVVGVLSVVLPIAVAAVVWKAMAYTLAIYLIVSCGMQIYTITKLHRNGIMIRQSMIEVASSLVLALVLFIIPAQTAGHFIVRLFGLILLAIGIGLVLIQWKSRPEVVVPDSVETVEEEKESEN